jgi:trk system potassium uptake protein TrkH
MMEDSFIQGISHVRLPRMLVFIVKYTFILEGIGIVFFMLFFREPQLGKRLYVSVFHSISAFCNAGFSTYTDSLVGYHDHLGVNLVTMVLIICGGIGFIVAYEIRTKGKTLDSNRITLFPSIPGLSLSPAVF